MGSGKGHYQTFNSGLDIVGIYGKGGTKTSDKSCSAETKKKREKTHSTRGNVTSGAPIEKGDPEEVGMQPCLYSMGLKAGTKIRG